MSCQTIYNGLELFEFINDDETILFLPPIKLSVIFLDTFDDCEPLTKTFNGVLLEPPNTALLEKVNVLFAIDELK